MVQTQLMHSPRFHLPRPPYISPWTPFQVVVGESAQAALIKVGHVLPVKHALQGHPESPRLWATMINGILTGSTMKFTSTTHEPCLYHGFTQPLKLMGILTMHNGLDISQNNRFVKLSCKTYITKNTGGPQLVEANA